MIFVLIFVLLLCQSFGFSLYATIAVLLFTGYAGNFFKQLTQKVAFREFILFLYSLNYLFSPALMYNGLEQYQYYDMLLDEETYFKLVIPAILLLHTGMFLFKTAIFSPNLNKIKLHAILNEPQMVGWVIGGILIRFAGSKLPSELAFFAYLISSLRYVGVFGLLLINPAKYRNLFIAVFIFEIAAALAQGMFHDLVMWVLFLGLLVAYIFKPTNQQKLVAFSIGVFAIFVLQLTKSEYRNKLSENQSGAAVFVESVKKVKQSDENGFFTIENIANAFTRINQGWILANTIDYVSFTEDFQRWDLLKMYAEAAFLPRFLAPNKLKAGDKTLFARFTGHELSETTSMGLGFFADGFISFGTIGIWLFALMLGMLFSIIFVFVQRWSGISPFFVFFIFPILNYAVRPDCETQTIMGHIVKSLVVFEMVTRYYEWYFRSKYGYLAKQLSIKRALPKLELGDIKLLGKELHRQVMES